MTRTENRRLVRELRSWVWKPDPDLFTDLEVPTLRDVLAAGNLLELVGPEDVDSYCKIAAVRWSDNPELGADCLKGSNDAAVALATLIDNFRFNFVYALSGDVIDESDDCMTVKTPRGPLDVTEDKVRHWEWMLTILTDEMAARTLLAQAPESSRALAEETVVLSFAQDFDKVLARVREDLDLAGEGPNGGE